MTWNIQDPQGNESKKIVWEVAPYLKGRGLDVGAGDFRILPHAITVDNLHHHQHFGFQHKPDIVAEADNLEMIASKSMDFVYSSHTLEHLQDTEATLREWWRVLKVGGYLVLYLPHKDFYPNIGQPGANTDHKHDFLPEHVTAKMPAGFDLLENQERNEGMEYSFLQVYQKLSSKERRESWRCSKPEKTACVVRYGAFGDLMQSSSVFAALKKQGYHVTLFSSLPGAAVVENDPHLDKIVLFDKDQVPNANLTDFWNWQKKKFDKWVNLSESVEGALLAMPGRTIHFYPPALRHSLMNRNYTEMQHAIAETPYKLESRFYPTEGERTWAQAQRRKIGGSKVVVWSLAGSSVHKTWAGLDNILASFMVSMPDVCVVLVGGPECVILESGWENEPRIVKTSGVWSIRQSLAFLEQADLIIGPETGVMNAAALLPARKIVFLSHSTAENLTRDWVNTTSLWAKNTACPGRGNGAVPACHQLHYGWDHCKRDAETGTAQCQKDIPVEEVWDAIAECLSDNIGQLQLLSN
jgi:ADP-heptose:LPS heptosyltransferase/predicted SAM-dependent methyltransferase